MCRRLQYSTVLTKLLSYPVVRVANITATIRSKSIILLAYPGIQYFAEIFFGEAVGWLVGYMMMSNCAMGGGMQLWCYRIGIRVMT